MLNFTQRLWFKNAMLLAGFAYLVFQSAFCVFNADVPLFIHIIGWMGLIFFGGGGTYVLYRSIVLRTRGLRLVTLSDEGLILNGELIPWSAIEGFEPMNPLHLKSVNEILVRTNNCEEIIASTRNPIKRWSRRRSLAHYGAIYVIDESHIDGSLEAFTALCSEYMEKDRKKRERLDY